MNASFDVVIVGGGVTGAAVGYGLAKRGVKTCLVDAVPTFSRASRANMGLIWCQSKALGCPQFVRWGFASSRAYGKLAAELKELSGIDTGYAPTGGIIPCLGEAELEARAQFIEKLRAETEDGTYPASVLSRKELEGMLPKVPFGPEVSGGIWSDMDGYVDPLHLMFAFRKSFVRLGGTLFAGERVSEVKPSGKGYTVVCGGRTLECGKAVLAAGLGVRKLAAQLGTDIPVFPNKSQVMLLERIPADVLPIPLLGIARTFGGTVMIGAAHENMGMDRR
ncbi:MAG: NAD(P)/FAD-dependent oxidoreductase, partial [Bilophila wadsworthia]